MMMMESLAATTTISINFCKCLKISTLSLSLSLSLFLSTQDLETSDPCFRDVIDDSRL